MAHCNEDMSASDESGSEYVPNSASSGSEYVPNSASSEDETIEIPLPLTSLTTQSEATSDSNLPSSSNSHHSVVRSSVQVSGRLAVGKHKTNACYFCSKKVTRICRHLVHCHAGEKAIIDIGSLGNKEEKEKKLQELRLKGNYRYNIECISKGEGNLIVMRSPRFQSDPSKFLPCPYCYGFLCRRELNKHCRRCQFRPKDFTVPNPIEHGKLLLLPYVHVTASDELKNDVLRRMSDDIVKAKVVRDELILSFGNTQVNRLRASQGEKMSHLSYRLRILGKLLLECERLKGGTFSLTQLLQPTNFDLMVTAIRCMTTGKEKPKSLGLKIGHAVRKCCVVARCIAIKTENEEAKRLVENFSLLMDGEYQDMVSSSLLREMYDAKLNKDTVLPVTSDLLKLSQFINNSLQSAIEEMSAFPCAERYSKLSKLALCKIIVFNKRRGGEASRITVDEYVNRPNWSSRHNEDIFNSLSVLEKKLSDRLDMLQVKGKRGRHVPILLTPDLVKAMDILVRDRCHIGFQDRNKYFFATKGLKYLRGHDVLNEVVNQITLSNPAAITSTNLRKYIATVTQIVSLEKEELEWVADHLGHNIEVHRSFYRLQESTLELSKVSKLLLAIENGKAHSLAGKKLSDISIAQCFPDDECYSGEENSNLLFDDNNLLSNESELRETNCATSQDITLPEVPYTNKQTDKCPSSKESCKSKKPKKLSWDPKVKAEILKYFRLFLDTRRVPGKNDCERCLRLQKITNRSWKDVKYLIYNQIQIIKRKKV